MLKTIQERLAMLSADVRLVSAREAREELIANGGALIDVREPTENSESPVPTALLIPRGLLEMKATEQFKDPDRPLYLHCGTGVRAQLAAEQLSVMGYTRVAAITNGIKDVQAAFTDGASSSI